jgi:hypothetical protein
MRIPIRACALAALVASAVAGCATSPAKDGGVGSATGVVHARLMHHERAVGGAVVSAVRNPGVIVGEERVEAVAGPDGRAAIALPPGVWFVSARAPDPPLFGWYGSNPVTVRAGERLDLVLPAVPLPSAPQVAAVPEGEEGLSGTVVGEDGPVAAAVALYLDASTQFRGPGYLEAQAGPDGRFAVSLSPGRYWVFARRRGGPAAFGPLEVGDVFGSFPGNPVTVRAGERLDVRIPAVRVLKKSGWSGPSELRVRVGGTIRDASGRPLAGYRAFLHAKAPMLGKPEFVSEPSGADGVYAIWVDREGTYYLGARAEIGRARGQDEAIGLYRGAPGGAVTVRLGAGDLAGRDIVVGGPQP